jgi:predicted aldo/keto reductase-like oxidoreductase
MRGREATMIYKQFKDKQLSTLGMGNMRLPTVGARGPIDAAKAREIIEYAYENGVNYFDTAFRYHDGESETIVGEVMSQYPRESWYLATKMPGHMMSYKNGKLDFVGYLSGLPIKSPADIFEQQLKKCRVDYFDFYLLHNLQESTYGTYTDEDLGIVEYLISEKKAGRIKHLGFSAHGRADTIENFLNWKDCFEFVQIQINYLDWTLQDAKRKYEVITKHGLPVIAMEPVRGGRLASLTENANAILKNARPDDTIASWAFRFLQSLPNMQVVLSGMTTMEQIIDNVKTFSKFDPLTEAEKGILNKAVAEMADLVPCTACRYCCEACPQYLDIPKLISMYNESSFVNPHMLSFSMRDMKENELPTACLGCGHCKSLCPQGINIPAVMQKFSDITKKLPKVDALPRP